MTAPLIAITIEDFLKLCDIKQLDIVELESIFKMYGLDSDHMIYASRDGTVEYFAYQYNVMRYNIVIYQQSLYSTVYSTYYDSHMIRIDSSLSLQELANLVIKYNKLRAFR